MAHYACDCWDGEIEMFSRGWTECVGIADRSAFDLNAHSIATKSALQAFVSFPDGPRDIEVLEMKPVKGLIGKQFRADAKPLLMHLESMDETDTEALEKALSAGSAKIVVDGVERELTSAMVTFARKKKRVVGQNITPAVIEPSFGIGRILVAVLEHSYYVREGNDEARHALALPAVVAPVKCSVLPLMAKPELLAKLSLVSEALTAAGVSYKVDDSGVGIGKRYARTDEIGIPFAITIDYETLESDNDSVTLRERDSMAQVRMPLSEAVDCVRNMSVGLKNWKEVSDKYPAVEEKA
jgi:glycyl-tRNA synthetase